MDAQKHIKKEVKDRELSGKEDTYKSSKKVAQGKEKRLIWWLVYT